MKTGYWYINPNDFSHFKAYYDRKREDLILHSGNSFSDDFQQASFSSFKSYIESNHIPALVFWGSCSQCLSFRSQALSHSNFKSYASSTVGQPYMYFIASDASSNSDVKEFCRSSTREFPYIRLYWKKSNGDVASCDVSRGTSGYANSAAGATNLVNKMKQTFSSYSPAAKFIITFSANGGEGSYAQQEVIQGKSFNLPSSAKFRRSGYKQSGWIIGSTNYAFGAKFTPTSDTTVKAAWTVDAVEPPQPSPDIPVDDPTFEAPTWQFSKKIRVVAASKDKFPYKWQYKTNGYKRIAISNNISSLNAHGIIENVGLENQIISAYIDPKISEIEPRCFSNCTNLVGINANNNITKVREYAFYNCHSLKAINFLGDANSSLSIIGSYAFYGCGFRSIKINHTGSVSDSSMDDWCFGNNKELTGVQFLKSTYLGAHMFDGCDKLTNIKLNNYHSYVGDYAFANCKSLAKISLPPKTYMISEHMFDGCTSLASVVFENGSDLRQVGDYAFANCPKLTSITLPPSVNDLWYLDPQWLAGSSIDRVTFQGLSDDWFADIIQRTVDAKFNVGKLYVNNYEVLDNAAQMNIPVFAYYTNLNLTTGKGCGQCERMHNHVFNTSDWKTWMGNQTYYFVVFDENADCQTFGSKTKKLFGANWGGSYAFPFGLYYWKNKESGVVKTHTFNRFNSDSAGNTLASLKSTLTTAMSEWHGITETTITIKEELNTFGRNAPIIYVSSTGNEYKCENNTVTKLPTYRVDHRTKDNFKYSIWYYNARELKAFADQHHLPVLAEWGARSCDPCRDFMKSTFRKKQFQDELKKRSCLLCKVQLEREGSFSSQPATSQEYFISHNWGNPNSLIPQLILYWNKSASEIKLDIWNYNYRTDPANANYETVLNKLDEMLKNYTGAAQYVAPTVTTSGNGKYRYYSTESIVESGYTVESGKYVKSNGSIESISTAGYAVITINVDPTCIYYIYTCCDSEHCIHAYNSSGEVVGAIKNNSGTIIGSDCIINTLPNSISHSLAIYQIELPSNAKTLKITNAYQTANGSESALPLRYRATYDCDGRYFICDKKTKVESWSGKIDIDMAATLHTGAGDSEVGAGIQSQSPNNSTSMLKTSANKVQVGMTIDLVNNWYQWNVPDPAQPSFIDKSGIIFKVYDKKVESVWTFENEDEVIELDYDGLKYPVGQWHMIDDTTGSSAITEIIDQCETNDIPIIIFESKANETSFITQIKASDEFSSWVKKQNYVFMDIRSNSWSSNGPKTFREFESKTGFDSNSTSDALPKILVYKACSTCNDDGSLTVEWKKKIAYNSSWKPDQYINQIKFYLGEG